MPPSPFGAAVPAESQRYWGSDEEGVGLVGLTPLKLQPMADLRDIPLGMSSRVATAAPAASVSQGGGVGDDGASKKTDVTAQQAGLKGDCTAQDKDADKNSKAGSVATTVVSGSNGNSNAERAPSGVSASTMSSPATWRAGGFGSWSSFGSVIAEEPARVSSLAWPGSCCCDCVPLRLGTGDQDAGAPVAFEGPHDFAADGKGSNASLRHHRRGRSTGSAVRQGVVIPPSSGQISSQPRGWENCKQHQQQHHRNASSAGTSTLSSIVTAATASATSATFSPAPTTGGGKIAAGRSMGGSASVGDNERAGHTKGPLVAGGRRSGSWGGVSALDREFHVILKAGVDVYKHCSMESTRPLAEGMSKTLKGLWSRKSPMDDGSQGLVTLFLDKQRDHLCWCQPGAAELVPDERYRINVHQILEVTAGGGPNPRCISLRSSGRLNPLRLEPDSDELYDILYQGLVRILQRNTLGVDTFVSSCTAL